MTPAPEDRLLLDATRVELAPEHATSIARSAQATLDWRYVLDASIRHGVAPLLHRALHEADSFEPIWTHVPDWLRRDLDMIYDGAALRAARVAAATADVVSALRAAGVESLGLKDVVLAATVFPDPALRPPGDVDLLIRRADYEAAAEILGGLGFAARPAVAPPYTLKYGMGQHFRRAADDLWLDVQWNVMQREWDPFHAGTFTYDPEDMWLRAIELDLDGRRLLAPAPEDMLFHLCIHLEGHEFAELILFCDIAEMLRRGPAIDWKRLHAITRRYHQEGAVFFALRTTRLLLEAPVPDDVLDELRPSSFHGALLRPLFANLGQLHTVLDDLRLDTGAPEIVLDDLELVTRRQTARAIALDRELAALATAFADATGRPLLYAGRASPRLFPDPTLPAFSPLDAFVLADDLDAWERALAEHGFTHNGLCRSRPLAIETADPLLAAEPVSLRVEVELVRGLEAALEARDAPGSSNAAIALKSLRRRPHGRAEADVAAVGLHVHVLDAEELVVAVLVRTLESERRLFALCWLHELGRAVPAFDEARVMKLAAEHGVAEVVAGGRNLLEWILAEARIDNRGDAPAPRLLEWARYGREASTLGELRGAYYAALVVRRLRSTSARLRFGTRAAASVGPGALAHVATLPVRAVTRRLRPARPSPVDHAYWIDRDVAARLTLGESRGAASHRS